MKTIISIAVLISMMISSVNLMAQDETHDPKAKAILDELSIKLKTYETISAEFNLIMDDSSDPDMREAIKGKLKVKGKFYNMDMLDQITICDGSTVWTVREDEVEIMDAPTEEEEKEEGSQISPTTIFKFYEDGFKYKYDKETTVDGIIYEQIKLFPEDLNTPYHTIILTIDKANMQIKSVKQIGKDGMTYTINLVKFETNIILEDAIFKFSKSDYPGIDINDLR
ncbi:MAG: outer membrane lipoprotein carrier protein LolA [Flavobacteriales bacterium]|nr:outer membrane lipoprotein carrier protein LolA [Flavobacteriales bacterium]